ncbi:F0F1 ATP synthase subunit delta [Porticoccus sp.]
MELNWSTFLLEIINFLVLLWILKHFLYKPVLNIIAKRQEGVDKVLDDAQTLRSEAETMQQQYEARLDHWEQERQQARDTLKRELEAVRNKKLEELKSTLVLEREKIRVADAQRLADQQRKMEATAMAHGAQFAGQLLKQAAGPEVEAHLVNLVIAELGQLTTDQLKALHSHNGAGPSQVIVQSAHPLSQEQRQLLQQVINQNGWQAELVFKEEPELLAGLHIAMGAWVLAANLRDELRGFAELTALSDKNSLERESQP